MLSQPNRKPFLFSLPIFFPIFLCQQSITLLAQRCDENAFQCGSVSDISYPFWGGRRPVSCGRQGFLLTCQAGVPMINISSLSYRVQEIDFDTNTLRIAREDLWNTPCPKVLHNTTIDFDLFQFYPDSDDKNVTLFFDCTNDRPGAHPNQFNCSAHGTFNVFWTGNASSGPGRDITCSNSISVPVNKNSARSLETPSPSSINVLQSALATGFTLQWQNDPLQYTRPFCNANVYGSCIRTGPGPAVKVYPAVKAAVGEVVIVFPNCVNRSCRRSNASEPASAPGQSEGPTGNGFHSPVQSPASSPGPEPDSTPTRNGPSPGPERHESRTGNGLHSPVQSPASSPGPEPDSTYTRNGFSPVQSPGSSHKRGRSNSLAGNGHRGSLKWIPVGLTVSITGIMTVSIIFYSCLKRRYSPPRRDRNRDPNLEIILQQHESLAPKRYKYSEIKKITNSFTDKLGQGGYGSVYKGMLADGCPVAVKVLIDTEGKSNGEEFINEVASISRTSHVNIVNLLGFCYDRNKKALVYEFMPNKSLDKFTSYGGSPNAACQLELKKLYKIAIGVAKGLEYLHTGCNTRIVHFDIKPQNILLDEDFCPKISDFGLAKLCKKQSIISMLGARGTVGYIAPEIFCRNFGGVSHKSDVYSYGMMVLEMVGAKQNIKPEANQSSENYFPDRIYDQVIHGATRMAYEISGIEEEEELARKLFLVGFWCIQTNPSDRPSMSKVVEMLEGSLQSIQIPPKPVLFCPKLSGQELSPSLSVYVETESST